MIEMVGGGWMDVDGEKKRGRGRGAEQVGGDDVLRKTLGRRRVCLPPGFAIMSSEEQVAAWQELSVEPGSPVNREGTRLPA